MRQLSELYLRGSLINETMKNLSAEQMQQVEDELEKLMNMPSLNKCKQAICGALAKTIRGDYAEDREAALQEYRIALMRAVIYAKFHKPTPDVFTDPIQQRKFFSHMAYNYMRQILNENKIPHSKDEMVIDGPPHEIAFEHYCNLLDQNNIEHSENISLDDEYYIYGDIGLVDLKLAKRFGRMQRSYAKCGVEVSILWDHINIKKKASHPDIEIKLTSKHRIKSTTMESEDDEGNSNIKYNIEYEILSKETDADNSEHMNAMRSMLPSDLVEIFDLVTNAPDEFANTYGTYMPSKKQIAQHLNISDKEVTEKFEKLKMYYFVVRS
jgi:hypothetical protein